MHSCTVKGGRKKKMKICNKRRREPKSIGVVEETQVWNFHLQRLHLKLWEGKLEIEIKISYEIWKKEKKKNLVNVIFLRKVVKDQWRLQEFFWEWSLRNLNYTKSNKKRILYIDKTHTHTHTYKHIKSYNFLLQIFLLFWNRYMIVSLLMLQVTSLQKFS